MVTFIKAINSMLDQKEILYSLALSYTKGIGIIAGKKLIEHFGSSVKVFEQNKKDLYAVQGLGLKESVDLNNKETLQKAENEIKFCERNNTQILHYKSDKYPSLLKECTDCPIIIFQKGEYNWDSKKSISIVGTRNITDYGKTQTESIVEGLAGLPISTISGLAYGVDITTHLKSIEKNIPTIAVLGHGLHKIYPSAHQKYVAGILEGNGALLSEFSSFHDGDRNFFLQRNRIIAGLSMATIIVESDIKGGSLSTAKYANNYNREVFAIPGKIGDKFSLGCNHLIKTNQAHLFTSIKDLDYYTSIKNDGYQEKVKQTAMPLDLDENLESIYLLLKEKGKMHIDDICISLNQPSYLLLGDLLELEMSGLIKNLPGKVFDLI